MIKKGYHGTTKSKADLVDGTWSFDQLERVGSLGSGIYFFTDSDEDVAYENAFKYPFTKDNYPNKSKSAYTDHLESTKVISLNILTDTAHEDFNLDQEPDKTTFINTKQAIVDRALKNNQEHLLLDDKIVNAATIKALRINEKIGTVSKVIKPPHELTKSSSFSEPAVCTCVIDMNCIVKKTIKIVKEVT